MNALTNFFYNRPNLKTNWAHLFKSKMLENILDSIPGYENSSLDTKYHLMLSWLPLFFLVTIILPGYQNPSCSPETVLFTRVLPGYQQFLPGYQNPLWLPESSLVTRILSICQNPFQLPESFMVTRIHPSYKNPSFLVTRICCAFINFG